MRVKRSQRKEVKDMMNLATETTMDGVMKLVQEQLSFLRPAMETSSAVDRALSAQTAAVAKTNFVIKIASTTREKIWLAPQSVWVNTRHFSKERLAKRLSPTLRTKIWKELHKQFDFFHSSCGLFAWSLAVVAVWLEKVDSIK